MANPPKISVIYYSATGNVARLAHEIARGAESIGAEIRLRHAEETAPAEAIARNPGWQEFADQPGDPLAQLEDLVWADGIALGSPTRFGGPASQLKAFLDTSGGLWAQGAFYNKVGTAFTSASTQHGGLESTILAMNNIFYHWGTLIMPLGYPDEQVRKYSGNPYGASHYASSRNAGNTSHLAAAFTQGKRLAQVSAACRNMENT
jgi:NAD(P)H dehydrogenase (quinone)|tara:strand:- start:561 stop:1175 length:615 start_codon:yes stop_codon:yes gene_type:complete